MSSVLLPRPRLHERLDQARGAIAVIAGPSGFGKTSLVRAWVEPMTAQDVIWLPLGADRVSRLGLWHLVLDAAERLGVLTPAEVAEQVQTIKDTQDPARPIAAALAGRGPIVVVIDAYERLREMTDDVDADLRLISELAPELTFVVTTRAQTGLARPGRTLRGEVHLLTEDDLAFTEDEARDLLRVFGRTELLDDAQRLCRATLGYPLALRAAMLSLDPARRLAPITSSKKEDWQALVAEDLRVQLGAGEAYEFVLATCLPPYCDVDLAASLVGTPAAQELLDDLAWNGFGRWIPFAPGRQVFQYAEALRDAMLVEAERHDPTERARRAELAAGWLHQHGNHEAAFELAVGAGLFGVAARVYALLAAINQDAVSSTRFDQHLALVPSKALAQFPALAFGRGLACHRDPALRGLAAQYFKIPAAWSGPRFADMTPGEVLLGHVSKTVSLRLLNRFVESGRAAQDGLAFRAGVGDPGQAQWDSLQPVALRHLAYSLFQAGELDQARDTINRGIAEASDARTRNETAVYAVGFHAFEGRSAEAHAALDHVDAEAWRPGQTFTYANALGRIGQSTLHLDSLDFSSALGEYEGCESFTSTSEFWPLVTWTLMHARLGLGQAAAEAHRVEQIFQLTPPPPGAGDSLTSAAVRATLAISWLAAGNRPKAGALLRQPTRHEGQFAAATMLNRLVAGEAAQALAELPRLEAAPGHTLRSSAALITLGAAAAIAGGHDATARALLERAVALTGPDGARIHLLYLPSEALNGLRRVAADGSPQVRAYLAGQLPTAISHPVPADLLTRQERAVLAEVLLHPNRAALAQALHLSENTVKTHLQRIYRKLGVTSRREMIEKAIELDLVNQS